MVVVVYIIEEVIVDQYEAITQELFKVKLQSHHSKLDKIQF